MPLLNFLLLIFNLCYFIINFYLTTSYLNKNKQNNLKLEKQKVQLLQQISNLKLQIHNTKLSIQEQAEQEKEKSKKQINLYIEKEKQKANQYLEQLKEQNTKKAIGIQQEFEKYKQKIEQQKETLNNEVDNLRNTYNAGIELQLREQQKKDKINFYKLSLTKEELSDVQKLEQIKPSLNKPVILSKLIWTQYFQKQMNELCERVVGKKIVCGIYKITNILDNKCYIGQSVNVQERFKQHCKCGLGIDASATNKLYNAMQKDKIWNFTFEVLEECPKELLNEKERFWINMFQSNMFGYNFTKGNI